MGKNLISLGILTLLLVACEKENENYVKFTSLVDITSYTLPDSGKVGEVITIPVEARGNSGCWSNLYFLLDETDEKTFEIKALGTYESYGYCLSVFVEADTLLNFSPKMSGIYMFEIFESTEHIEVDSVVIL